MAEITLFKAGGALPDYLQDGDDLTKAIAGSTSSSKSISIEGGVWRMLVGGEEIAKNEERAMNFIIVNAAPNVSRVYYDSVYVKGQVTTPACYSTDGKGPAENSSKPQAANCATCPQNVKGSGQGESRACRFFQRVAVALEGDLDGNVYRLQLPALSTFGDPENGKLPFKAYAKFLAGHGVPINGVVTEARFDTSKAVPVLRFSAVRPLSREEFEQSKALRETKDAIDAITVNFAEAKASAQQAVMPRLESKPAKPVQVEEAVAEPAKRARKPEPPVVASTKDVDELMAQWGSDDE